VNGDSFITDQNVPIWLKGWTSGSNSLQLELLDGRGKALNPPFNSLVSELVLKPSAPKPRWQLGRLSPEELASLVGQTPTPATPRPTNPKAAAAPIPAPEPPPQPTTKPEPQPAEPAPQVEPQAAVEEVERQTAEPEAAEPQPAIPQTLEPQPAETEPAQSENAIVAPDSAEASGRESATTASEESPAENGEQTLLEDNPVLAIQPSDSNSEPNSGSLDDDAGDQPTVLAEGSEEPLDELPSPNPDAPAKAEDSPNPEELARPEVLSNRDDPAESSASGGQDAVIPPPITNPDRLAPSTSVAGSARDQVHEDGSLIKPKPKGPLAGLRERLAS
jgi:hypothetical protein